MILLEDYNPRKLKAFIVPKSLKTNFYGQLSEYILDYSEDELIKIQTEWDDIDIYNKDTMKHNKSEYSRLLEDYATSLESFGIKVKKIHKTTKEWTGNYYSNFQKIAEELKYSFDGLTRHPAKPRFESILVHGKSFKTNNCFTLIDIVKSVKLQISRDNISETKYELAIRKAYINEIDIEDIKKDKVYSFVNDKLGDIWVKEQLKLPENKNIDISDICDECDTFFPEESNRCSCGNCRISASYEGDFVNGYELIFEQY